MRTAKTRVARLVYTLVAYEDDVLVDFSALSGNFPTAARMLLSKLQPTALSSNRISYMYDSHAFHCVVLHGVTYLCMSDEEFPRELAFDFLEKVSVAFAQMYNTHRRTNRSSSNSSGIDAGNGNGANRRDANVGQYGSLLDDGRGELVLPVSTFSNVSYAGFRSNLKRIMKEHNANARTRATNNHTGGEEGGVGEGRNAARGARSGREQLRDILDDGTNPAIENIEKLLGRGEKIDLVVDLSDNESPSPLMLLQTQQGRVGRRKARRRCIYFFKSVAFLLAIMTAVCALVFTLACGGPYLQHCSTGLVQLGSSTDSSSEPTTIKSKKPK